MDQRIDDPLGRAFRLIAREEAESSASAASKARLLAEVRTIGVERRRRIRKRFGAALLGVAAAVSAVVGLAGRRQWRGVVPSTASRAVDSVEDEYGSTPFLPLAYSTLPASDAQMIRVELPRSALASFGLEPIDGGQEKDRAGTVLADVLVGEDGLARAVRFVHLGATANRQHEESRR